MTAAVLLSIPYLPNYQDIGANARHNGWRSRWRAEVQERDRWKAELAALGYVSREQPLLSGDVIYVMATLWFPTRKVVDQADNLIAGLKFLFDVLEPWRIINRKLHVRGYAGIYENDRQLQWLEPPVTRVDPIIGPRTEVEFFQGDANGTT